MATTKIIKSTVLQPGEKFILPPNSTLKGSSDGTALSSTCTTPTLEDLVCAEIVIMGANKSGSNSIPYSNGDSNDFTLDSLTIGNVVYDISDISPDIFGHFDLSGLVTYIGANPSISGLFTDINTATFTDAGLTRGSVDSMCFKTLPSLINQIYITATTGFPTGAGTIQVRFYAQSFGTYVGSGSCTCTLISV